MQKIRYILRQFGIFVLIYKFMKKFLKRMRFRYREKVKGETITKEEVLKAIPRTGLKKGDKVIIHSSMSSIGVLEEGPKTIVEALMKFVGPEGLILMPSFPHTNMHKYLTENIIFDVRKSPSKNGIHEGPCSLKSRRRTSVSVPERRDFSYPISPDKRR